MKKTAKNFFALLLAALMIASVMPFSAAAEEEFTLHFRFLKENYNPNTQKYEDTYAWVDGYSGTPAGELTIPDEAEGNPVVGVWYNTFKGADKITKINFGKNMHYILDSAFEGCTGITELTIPGKIMNIEKNAFLGCTSIKNLVLEEGVTNVGEAAFKNCTSLETAVLPESLERLNSFENCSSLKSIVIPSRITDINGFAGCSSLESVTIPETARTIEGKAFMGCSSLKSIVIPNSVHYLKWDSFKDCTALADITVSNDLWELGSDVLTNTAFYNNEDNWENGVLYIDEYVFAAKKDLTGEVIIKDGTSRLANEAFLDCTEITGITFPESFHCIGDSSLRGCTSLVDVRFLGDGGLTVGGGAFVNCSSIKKLDLPDIGGFYWDTAFFGCSSLESINVPYDEYGAQSIDGVLFEDKGKTLEYCPEAKVGRTYKIPDGVEWVNDRAFYKNHTIENLVIPESVTTVEMGAFCEMKALKKFNIPKSMTAIPTYAFYGCSALEWVAIPDHVTEIGGAAFEECSNLRYIRLPEGLTKISGSAFYKCPELKKIAIPESVTEIGGQALGYLQYEQYKPVIYTDGFTIYGYSDSAAEKYAEKNKLAFADISLFVDEPEPDWDFSEPEPDVPEEPDDPKPEETCSCRCHKGGFQGFMYKIFRIFWKIFRVNEYCVCGAKHY